VDVAVVGSPNNLSIDNHAQTLGKMKGKGQQQRNKHVPVLAAGDSRSNGGGVVMVIGSSS